MKLRIKRFTYWLFPCIGIALTGGIFFWFVQEGRVLNLQAQQANSGHNEDRMALSVAGINDDRLLAVLIEDGMAAVQEENLKKSMNLFSPEYRDSLGFTAEIMRTLIKKAYKSFDEPKVTIQKPPVILIDEKRAVLHAEVRMSVVYSGQRNYILGDKNTYNSVLVTLKKYSNGWKVTSIEDLRPLDFDAQLLRHLGADLGLHLNHRELDESRKYCMPCRLKMKERFGSGYSN